MIGNLIKFLGIPECLESSVRKDDCWQHTGNLLEESAATEGREPLWLLRLSGPSPANNPDSAMMCRHTCTELHAAR
jgi:hypothetical protein